MPMRHVITEGDTTSGLASQHGFSPHTIWNHPDNAGIRQKRRDMNILMPGDILIIPDKQLKQVTAATEQLHRFVLRNTPALFQLQLYHADGTERSNQDYRLVVDDRSYSGTTDGQGLLIEYISPRAKAGRIELLPEMDRIDLRFGTLNPLEEDSGVRRRLANLGFPSGDTAEELRAALTAFQKDCQLEPTGELNEQTRRRLAELHDTVSDYPVKDSNENDAAD